MPRKCLKKKSPGATKRKVRKEQKEPKRSKESLKRKRPVSKEVGKEPPLRVMPRIKTSLDVPHHKSILDLKVRDNLEDFLPYQQNRDAVEEVDFEKVVYPKKKKKIVYNDDEDMMSFKDFMFAEITQVEEKLSDALEREEDELGLRYEEELNRNKKILKIWEILQGKTPSES